MRLTRPWYALTKLVNGWIETPIQTVLEALMSPPRRFLVVSSGRSGSNFLMSLLQSHPKIRHCGEIIGEWNLRDEDTKAEILARGTISYVQECLRRQKLESVVGVKVLYYQVWEEYAKKFAVPDIPELRDFLVGDKGIKVIHLKRRNLFDTLVSRQVAAATRQYMLAHEDKRLEVQVEISPEECIEYFGQSRRWEQQFDELFADHKLLEIFYEDLSKRRNSTCDRVLEFLEVYSRTLDTGMIRQRTRPKSEVVANYDALKKHFEGSEWEEFFKE